VSLLDEMRAMIAAEGPVSVERYMSLCLGHPVHGYYVTRDPFGAGGDFTTAPEISQVFGEMIGAWAVEVWQRLGSPRVFRLVELGPGRGTLMADLLRAARVRPSFLEAARVHLVETSPTLRRLQAERLRDAPAPIAWHARLGEVPGGPAIVIGNEFLDALPIRQYVATERGWCERLIGLQGDGDLAFGVSAEPSAAVTRAPEPGAVVELAPARVAFVRELATRLAAEDGAALLIDYGYDGPAFGDTLQAVRGHAFADPLAHPGQADLTAHVDFGALARAAQAAGASSAGPADQGEFLRACGIEMRAARLAQRAAPAQAEAIRAALERLIGQKPGQMGGLFKVLGLAGPGLDELPGLPPLRARTGSDIAHVS